MLTLATAFHRAGITQRAFAEALGVPESRVSEMLHGKRRLQPREYGSAAATLGLSANDLIEIVTGERVGAPRGRAA